MRRKAMIGKAVISLATGSLAVLLLGLAGTAALAQTGHEVVNCFDAALGTVHKTLARDCSGEIITDDKAAAVRDRKGVVERKSESVRVSRGGRRIIKKKKKDIIN